MIVNFVRRFVRWNELDGCMIQLSDRICQPYDHKIAGCHRIAASAVRLLASRERPTIFHHRTTVPHDRRSEVRNGAAGSFDRMSVCGDRLAACYDRQIHFRDRRNGCGECGMGGLSHGCGHSDDPPSGLSVFSGCDAAQRDPCDRVTLVADHTIADLCRLQSGTSPQSTLVRISKKVREALWGYAKQFDKYNSFNFIGHVKANTMNIQRLHACRVVAVFQDDGQAVMQDLVVPDELLRGYTLGVKCSEEQKEATPHGDRA